MLRLLCNLNKIILFFWFRFYFGEVIILSIKVSF